MKLASSDAAERTKATAARVGTSQEWTPKSRSFMSVAAAIALAAWGWTREDAGG